MAGKSFPFPHLTGENYNRWNIQMKTYLGGHDVWDAVESGLEVLMTAAANSSKLQKEAKVRDQKALSILQQGVDDANFERIAGATTAKEAWDLLNLDILEELTSNNYQTVERQANPKPTGIHQVDQFTVITAQLAVQLSALIKKLDTLSLI